MKQLLPLLIFVFGTSAMAADAKPVKGLYPYKHEVDFEPMPAPVYKSGAELKKNSRKPASADRIDLEKVNNGPFGEFRKEFLAASKSQATFHAFLVKIDDPAYFNTLAKPVQYFAAQMALLRPMRSVIYRLRPLFEEEAPRMIHSTTVTGVRKAAEAINIFLPDERWKVAFDYVTAPTVNPTDTLYNGSAINTNAQFHRIVDVQRFIAFEVEPRIKKAIERITPLQKDYGPDDYVWDNLILYPSATFKYGSTANPEQYHVHGPAEVAMVLSGLHGAVVRASVFNAYRRDEMFSVIGELGKLQGFDGFARNWEFGMTKRDRVAVLSKRAKFLTIYDNDSKLGYTSQQIYGKPDAGLAFMQKKAWPSFEHAARLRREAFDYLKANGPSGGQMRDNFATTLNPVIMLTNADQTETELNTVADLLKPGFHAMPSTITGETVQVNLHAIFNEPAPDLKAFLPTGFTTGANQIWLQDASKKRVVDPTTKEEIWWRNYSTGQANAWNNAAWSKYINVQGGNMAAGLRVLNQAWGGGMVAGPVAMAVR